MAAGRGELVSDCDRASGAQLMELGSYAPRGLSDGEALELLKTLRHAYLSPNSFPNLVKLVAELEKWAEMTNQVVA